MMGLKIYFVVLVLLAILWDHVAPTNPIISIKMNEKVIYDCINIYAQPSLKHPSLKHHKLQINPSYLRSASETGSSGTSDMKEDIFCPTGTVPIIRTAHEDKVVTNSFVGSILNQTKAVNPRMHVAVIVAENERRTVYTGVRAAMSIHNLKIAKDQVSLAQISLSTSANGQDNAVQAGWMINPSLFGDSRPWSFGYWLGSNGRGCYNTLCKGFVQISRSTPLSGPFNINGVPRGKAASVDISIQKDVKTGHWWVHNHYDNGKVNNIGYWPKELFNQMTAGSQRAVLGGSVGPSPTGSSPPMGNGYFPHGKIPSALFTNMMIAGPDYTFFNAGKFKLSKAFDALKCYNLEYQGVRVHFGDTMRYGGPGGPSC